MKDLINQQISSSEFLRLIGNPKETHVGYVFNMTYENAFILTNDFWKENVKGIPHNCFLVAASFNPQKYSDTRKIEDEIVLLRAVDSYKIPQDDDLIKTKIQQFQGLTDINRVDLYDGYDPITHNEIQFGGLKCRILGTFFIGSDGQLKLGSDIENFSFASQLRVYKPSKEALELIVNYVDPMKKAKAIKEAKEQGFKKEPEPFVIGTLRYTSTDRLHRENEEDLVPISIQPADFIARRTAVFGMTRTGKSNMVKTTVSVIQEMAIKGEVKIGQLIFDINGEYANANHKDDGSSISDVYETFRYRAKKTDGFREIQMNFYENCAEALTLLNQLSLTDPYRGGAIDLENFFGDSLEEPELNDRSAHPRWEVKRAIFQCILKEAGYPEILIEPDKPAPKNFIVKFGASKEILFLMKLKGSNLEPDKGLTLLDAKKWFLHARSIDIALKKEKDEGADENSYISKLLKNYKDSLSKEENDILNKVKKWKGLESSSGNPWFDAGARAFVNVLAQKNDKDQYIRGWKAISSYTDFHSPSRNINVADEIYNLLVQGKIIILDLSVGPEEIRKVLSERIARKIFISSMNKFTNNEVAPNIVIYVEEAHNLIGKKDELTGTWPRIAKEGAKAGIALVYSTQEPSSIHANILANTENWFVTHLNNDDELRELGKFYDFSDFVTSLKKSQDVGFARIKTLSSPFVVPTQIKMFDPTELKKNKSGEF
jgi:hypothetical protein